MNDRISPLKKLAAQLATALPAKWRFPVCGVAASVCGREETQPLATSDFAQPDARFLQPCADFLEPGHLSPLALVQSHLVAVEGGIAWSRGAHLTADGRVIDPISVGMTLSMDQWLVKRQHFFPKVQRVGGTVVSLSTDGHNNYYHWMLDLLPKLLIALAAGLGNLTFYLGASLPFQRQTLDLLGIPRERVIDTNVVPFLQADKLIVPFLGQRHPPNVFDAAKCRLLADTFAGLVDTGGEMFDSPARFVISRAKTRSRRVVNEAELLERLAPLGFRTIALENLTLLEQVTLFARAQAIVASTGAGLVNLIHASRGTPVAILMPEECPDLVCHDIAMFAGLRSAIFHAKPHPPGTPDRIGCDILLEDVLLAELVSYFSR